MKPCISCDEVHDRPAVPAQVTVTWADGHQEDVCRACATVAIKDQPEFWTPVQYAYDHPSGWGCEYALTGTVKIVREWSDGRVMGRV